MRDINLTELSEALAGVLESCLDHAMQLPLIMCAASPNGSVISARYEETRAGLKCEFLSEHIENGGFAIPLNIMITDQAGEAVRMLIDKDKRKYVFH